MEVGHRLKGETVRFWGKKKGLSESLCGGAGEVEKQTTTRRHNVVSFVVCVCFLEED